MPASLYSMLSDAPRRKHKRKRRVSNSSGWKNESVRHALASKGVSTYRKKRTYAPKKSSGFYKASASRTSRAVGFILPKVISGVKGTFQKIGEIREAREKEERERKTREAQEVKAKAMQEEKDYKADIDKRKAEQKLRELKLKESQLHQAEEKAKYENQHGVRSFRNMKTETEMEDLGVDYA